LRLVDRDPQDREQHFSEGEPDLEPPEEVAVDEWDDDLVLEEDLDCDIVQEEDVEDDVLQRTLEDLVHAADDSGVAGDLASDEFRCESCGLVLHRVHLAKGQTGSCRQCVRCG
jgi:hypothetical protein